MSRVGSGQKVLKYDTSGRVTLIGFDPEEMIRHAKSPSEHSRIGDRTDNDLEYLLISHLTNVRPTAARADKCLTHPPCVGWQSW